MASLSHHIIASKHQSSLVFPHSHTYKITHPTRLQLVRISSSSKQYRLEQCLVLVAASSLARVLHTASYNISIHTQHTQTQHAVMIIYIVRTVAIE
jgi:hypothetical protein